MDLTLFDNVYVPLRFKNFYEEIKNFNVYDDDVFICGYPKTGTTWTEEMVWLINNNLDYENAKKDLRLRSPLFEFSAMLDYRVIYQKPEDSQSSAVPVEYLENSIKFTSQIKSRPRQIKSHLAWNLLPENIRSFKKKSKIIYIMRNSKDACTSYYHFVKLTLGFPGSFDEFCQLFLDGKLLCGNYWNHYLSFRNYFNQPNVLLLKYEDMKRNLSETIKKVANFLNKTIKKEEIEKLEKHLNFKTMKENKFVNNEEMYNLCKKKYGINDEKVHFMRSGTTNDYQNIMSPEFIQKFDEIDKKVFENLSTTS